MRDAVAKQKHPLLPLVIQNVAYRVDDKALLDEINLTIPAAGGSCTAVMGPNGAGKSVLLRLINGLLSPDQGTVQWNGNTATKDHQQRQSMVFQRPVLLRRSVRANLDFVLNLRGASSRLKRSERSEALLALAGLTEHARTAARRLSGGEQQRLALACALATEPDILLLDEPTASLDPTSTAAIEAIVQDCVSRGMSVILVTHDAAQARRLAHSVIFLAAGRVTEHTGAGEFFHSPQSVQARDYLAGRLITGTSSSASLPTYAAH